MLGSAILQASLEFLRAAERRKMRPVHLISHDAQSFPHDAPHELSREEAVIAAQQELRRHVRPLRQRPRPPERRAGLMPLASRPRLVYDLARNIMENSVLVKREPASRRATLTQNQQADRRARQLRSGNHRRYCR